MRCFPGLWYVVTAFTLSGCAVGDFARPQPGLAGATHAFLVNIPARIVQGTGIARTTDEQTLAGLAAQLRKPSEFSVQRIRRKLRVLPEKPLTQADYAEEYAMDYYGRLRRASPDSAGTILSILGRDIDEDIVRIRHFSVLVLRVTAADRVRFNALQKAGAQRAAAPDTVRDDIVKVLTRIGENETLIRETLEQTGYRLHAYRTALARAGMEVPFVRRLHALRQSLESLEGQIKGIANDAVRHRALLREAMEQGRQS